MTLLLVWGFVKKWLPLAILLIVVWLVFRFGVLHERARKDVEIGELRLQYTTTLGTITAKAQTAQLQAEQAARAKEAQYKIDMAAIDLKWSGRMQDAKQKSDRDIAAVRSGELKLRDRFTCTGNSGSTNNPSEAGGSASVGDGSTARGFGKEDAVIAIGIADAGDAIGTQLSACQEIVRKDRQ